MVPVYEWLVGDDEVGCGTEVEFCHWQKQGTLADGTYLGAIVTWEPIARDIEREKVWAS